MSDRELLELAAKAAGYQTQGMEDGLMYLFGVQDGWNPLTDDGDALRLAVKLQIHLQPDEANVWATTFTKTVIHSIGDDRLAATRCAIVRAAAEIGKGMVAQPSGKDLPEDDYYKSQAEAFYGGKP